jgi:hypothetical protein
MPNRLMHWNVMSQQGNPTKSIEVNDLIKKIKKAEVSKKGKKSSAQRAIKKNEYHRMMGTFEHKEDMLRRYLIPSLVTGDAMRWGTMVTS